jgi:hypothetical protein
MDNQEFYVHNAEHKKKIKEDVLPAPVEPSSSYKTQLVAQLTLISTSYKRDKHLRSIYAASVIRGGMRVGTPVHDYFVRNISLADPG